MAEFRALPLFRTRFRGLVLMRQAGTSGGTRDCEWDDDADGDDARRTSCEGKRTSRGNSVWPRAPTITVDRRSHVVLLAPARDGRSNPERSTHSDARLSPVFIAFLVGVRSPRERDPRSAGPPGGVNEDCSYFRSYTRQTRAAGNARELDARRWPAAAFSLLRPARIPARKRRSRISIAAL